MFGLKKTLTLLSVLLATVSLQGCWFAAGAAAGAAGAEVLDEKGYEITSPIQEEDEED
tara:strand:- start:360 stop:533 length:174 start_codon:yes stop_codon:yes gene_type:complete